MLEVQKFLVQYNVPRRALEELTAQFGIKVRLYPEDGLVLLDYDQIESPKSHPIVIECRSLILAWPTFGIVSRKFPRFFNYGEAPDYYHDFDFKRAYVYEKCDGSLIGVYKNLFTSRWEISTRGMAKAEGPHVFYPSFRELALKTLGVDENGFQRVLNEYAHVNETLIFECIGPENRCVKKYEKPEMVLIGIVNNENGHFTSKNEAQLKQEVDRLWRHGFSNVRAPKIYPSGDVEDIAKMVAQMTDLDEGVVAFDPISNKRVKIKSATYVAAHKLRGNDPVPTRKNLLSVIFEGEIDELLAYFPEFTKYVDPIKEEIDEFMTELDRVWKNSCGIQSQKDFALAIKDFKGKSILFEARKQNEDPQHTFVKMGLNMKLKLFQVNQ